MSLFIQFVSPDISVDDMEQFFDTTFGSTVMVHFGPEKTNGSGKRYKTANVEVLGKTREMDQFIYEVEQFGYSTFMANNVSYTVQLDNRQSRPRNETFTKVTPRIV